MGFRSASLLFRRAMAGVALASVFALSACGGDDGPSGPSGDVYKLSSVDGTDFPIDETDAEGGRYRVSGYVALQTNGTYNFRVTESYDPTSGPTLTETAGEDGTYTISGSTITFTPTHDVEGNTRTPAADTDPFVGTKTATTITVEQDFSTYVFSK